MGSTPNWDIYYLENGDPQSQITESSVQAGTVEAALDQVGGNVESVNNFGVQYFVNASARDLALTSPAVGWLSQLDSELFIRRWDGSTWRPYGSGIFPLKPSSVSGTGVSINASGLVVASGASAITVDGCFSDDGTGLDAYELEVNFTLSTPSTFLIQLRSGELPILAPTTTDRR